MSEDEIRSIRCFMDNVAIELSELTEACLMLQRGLMEQNKLIGFMAEQIGRVLNERSKNERSLQTD